MVSVHEASSRIAKANGRRCRTLTWSATISPQNWMLATGCSSVLTCRLPLAHSVSQTYMDIWESERNEQVSRKRMAYYAVFDGHNGHRAAKFAAEHLHQKLARKIAVGEWTELKQQLTLTQANRHGTIWQQSRLTTLRLVISIDSFDDGIVWQRNRLRIYLLHKTSHKLDTAEVHSGHSRNCHSNEMALE